VDSIEFLVVDEAQNKWSVLYSESGFISTILSFDLDTLHIGLKTMARTSKFISEQQINMRKSVLLQQKQEDPHQQEGLCAKTETSCSSLVNQHPVK
jgi:hypothetical protein